MSVISYFESEEIFYLNVFLKLLLGLLSLVDHQQIRQR